MALSMEDKQKCAELFKLFADIGTEPRLWNEKAANTLAEMVKEILKCSRVMGIMGALYPLPIKVTWTWLCGIAYKIIVSEYRTRKFRVNLTCYRWLVSQYDDLIQLQLIGL